MTPSAHNPQFFSDSARLARVLGACVLLVAVGCEDGGAVTGDAMPPLDGDASLGPLLDGGLPFDGDASVLPGLDSGTFPVTDSSVPPAVDSSTPSTADSGTDAAPVADASAPDAAADGGGLPGFDDLFPPTPTPDASTPPPTTGDGGVDKSAPCADLKLFCIDPFDMFIFNPELCFTCNDGQGCQGCAIPYAY